MKKRTLLGIIAVTGLAGAAWAAEKWTQPQLEVAQVFRTWAEAEVAGDAGRIVALLAPEFTVWDLARPAPMDRAGYEAMFKEFIRTMKISACRLEPEAVQIVGDLALASGRYAETFTDADGKVTQAGGPWTSTLRRLGGKWLVLQVTYLEQAPADPAAFEQEIAALEHAWAKAYVDRDVAALDRMEADDWTCTTAEGEILTKARDQADVKSGTYQATVFKMEDVKVRVYGNMAVATALQTEVATLKGADANKILRCTDTWVRRDGRWQCVATHLSNAPR